HLHGHAARRDGGDTSAPEDRSVSPGGRWRHPRRGAQAGGIGAACEVRTVIRIGRPILLVAVAWLACGLPARAAAPLTLEATIPLHDVSGRIDHMAIDLARKRLMVAELGNNTVDVIDLDKRSVAQRISGLH